jgi:glycosyltransferase involved in cell wall biosynthesis
MRADPDADAPRFTVIVPCYDEEGAIRETVETLRRELGAGVEYELLVVDDGSKDASVSILAEIAAEDPAVRVVTHERNRGYGAALKTGIRRARSELLVITDADGTYPNERIPELVRMAEETDAEMVVGARTAADVRYPLIRKIPKWFLRRYASWVAGRNIPDLNSGLRVFRRSVVTRFLNILPAGFSFTTTITLAMLTNDYDVRFVPISYAARVGRSKIRPIRDTLHFCQLILRTGMYFAPIRVFFPVAMVLFLGFLASVAYDAFWLRNLTDKTVLLLLFTLNTAMFALLADMIDKRSGG